MAAKKKEDSTPKFDGALADRYGELQEQVKEAGRKHEALKKELSALEEQIIQNLPKDSTGVAGKRFRIQTVAKSRPVVDTPNNGWEPLYAFIKKTGRFDLLQRRLSEGAVKEMLEAGKAVPGITIYSYTDVKVTGV